MSFSLPVSHIASSSAMKVSQQGEFPGYRLISLYPKTEVCGVFSDVLSASGDTPPPRPITYRK